MTCRVYTMMSDLEPVQHSGLHVEAMRHVWMGALL